MSFALWAVHVSDGALTLPVELAGFALAGLLAAAAAWRLREDEIPRLALMTAAFFVASSVHVKLGMTSAHLMLVGLVGVVLRRRAPLAVLVGVALQALLVPHGGLMTVGVNACAEAVPALLAAGLFAAAGRAGEGRAWVRWLLVGVAAVVWGWCLLFAVGLVGAVGTNWSEVVSWGGREGLKVRLHTAAEAATAFALHPLALLALLAFAGLCVVWEARRPSPAGFARGALAGTVGVLATVGLTAAVLAFGMTDADAGRLNAAGLFVAHVPLALLEGLIVGSVVAFLWRVKPEMLGRTTALTRAALAGVVLLALAGPAAAHGLNVDHTIDRLHKRVTLTATYEGGDAPRHATADVFGEGGVLLASHKFEDGRVTFPYERIETLTVVVKAEDGHGARKTIWASELKGEAAPEPGGGRLRDLTAGVALLLAAAAFALAWRNSVRLSRLENKGPAG